MNDDVRRRSVVVLQGLVLGIAALARFWGLWFGLPHTQARPDETHIIEAARTMLSGSMPAFYDYPWLYIMALSALYVGYWLWGAASGSFHSIADMVASWPLYWEPFFLMSRALAAAFGTATVYVALRIGRRLWGDTAGILAAALLALTFLHVRDSHFGTTDTALTFFITASVGLLLEAHRTGRRALFVAAGIVGGLGAATKYNAVLLAAPIVASFALHVVYSEDKFAAMRDLRLFAYGLPFLAAFGIGIPFVALDYENFAVAMRDLQGATTGGTAGLGLQIGWVHHFVYSLRYGLGAPLLAASLLGAVLLLVRSRVVGVILLAFPVVYYGVAGEVRNLFFRYMIPVVPFLCLTAAYALWQTGTWLSTALLRSSGRRPPAALAAAVLGALVILPSAINSWRFVQIISRTDSRVLVSRWFAEHVPSGSSVLQSGSRYGLAQFERKLGYREWIWDGRSRAFKVKDQPATGEPDWIVRQDSPLPSSTQDIVTELLAHDYVLVTAFKAVSLRDDLIYDRQDMFYVPVSGLQHVTRPGPNFVVYGRRDAVSALGGFAADAGPARAR